MRTFLVARAHSIGSYSNLEHATCSLLAEFGEMPESTAAIIFFRMNNVRSMLEVLDKLKRQKVGVSYTAYWNSIVARSKTLAERRNEVVHWATAWNVFEDGAGNREFAVALKPPNIWTWSDDATPEIYQRDLEAFSLECLFQQGAVEHFVEYLRGTLPKEERDTWREILQQPSVYPPPPDHPLYQKPTEL
jgi:hypothetical protein